MHTENSLNPFLPFYNERLFGNRNKVAGAKRKILIVDDDQEISEVIKAVLERKGEYEVKMAADPYEAINMLLDEVYDFVILDWNLPQMNGLKTILEAEKIFRHDPTLPLDWESRKVKVVTFSGDDVSKCKIPSTPHFKYLGHVSKQNDLKGIVDHMQSHFNGSFALAS